MNDEWIIMNMNNNEYEWWMNNNEDGPPPGRSRTPLTSSPLHCLLSRHQDSQDDRCTYLHLFSLHLFSFISITVLIFDKLYSWFEQPCGIEIIWERSQPSAAVINQYNTSFLNVNFIIFQWRISSVVLVLTPACCCDAGSEANLFYQRSFFDFTPVGSSFHSILL